MLVCFSNRGINYQCLENNYQVNISHSSSIANSFDTISILFAYSYLLYNSGSFKYIKGLADQLTAHGP